jgi:hypothetical protein
LRGLVLGVVAFFALCSGALADSTALLNGAQSLLSTEVQAYGGSQGPFANGYWNTTDTGCWACDQGGPATGAATLALLSSTGGRSSSPTSSPYFGQAVATINTAIATRQGANGAFTDPGATGQSTEMATEFFGVEFGTVYRELSPYLSAATKASWQKSLSAAADYLIQNGNVTWYTNGNVNLGNTEFFYLVWQATGDAKYQQAEQQAWDFMVSPPQSQWPGDGLVIVKQPTQSDGSDGQAYLAETGSGGTGFDPEYTSLQLDIASRFYLLSGDPKVLRLANMLANMVLTRTNQSTWMLDTSGGTRHTDSNRYVNLLSSAFAVLGERGGRSDLDAIASSELQAETAAYEQQPWQDYNPVFRRALGNDISTIALAAAPAAVTNITLPFGGQSSTTTTTAPTVPTTIQPTPPVRRSVARSARARKARHAKHHRGLR